MQEGGKREGGECEEEGGRRRMVERGGRREDGSRREQGIDKREMDEWKKLVRKSLEEAEISESVILMILGRVEQEEEGIVDGGKHYKVK